MKELRAYQQSEAYKMCTEKIQEKKIKKGGKGPPPGSQCLLLDGWLWPSDLPPRGSHCGGGEEAVPGRGNTT